MKKSNFYAGIFLLMISIGTCIMAYWLGLGHIHNPGPGLIPFGVAGLLGLMSIGLCLRSIFEVIKVHSEEKVFKGIEWGRVVLVLCALLGYGAAFNFLGFRICTFFLMMCLWGVVGRQKWWFTLTLSLLTTVFTYFIFVIWLDCPFPKGPFGI